ncbi:MAG: hypothetical protein K0R26_2076 [Bacteroidota bacterium]|jgi:hypothetical protein|nr:hypothetical protein [Bacteroidota bacterium]
MKYCLFILFLFPLSLLSSNGEGPIAPRSAALGHASLTLFDAWSVRNNQGSLGFVRKGEAAAFYENRFLVKELSQTGFATAVPVKKGTFGLCYSSMGYQLYRESQATLSYGMKLSENISAGIGFDYLSTKIADIYGRAHAFTGSVGLTAKLLPQIIISSHVYNPFRAKITNYNNERVPTIIKFGAQYIFSPKVFFVAEAEKTSAQKMNIKGGIEYKPSSLIFIRVGGSSFPAQAAFGVGVNYNGLKIDLSSSYHSILGVSPQIGLSYSFGKDYSAKKNALNDDPEKL